MLSTRIGLCTDTHYWFDGASFVTKDGSLQLQAHSKTIQTTLLAELQKEQVDFVLHIGDLACGGGTYRMQPSAFRATLDCAHQALRQLSMPVYAIPGNHDAAPGEDWSYFEQLWGMEKGIGHTVDLPMARLVILNAQGHGPERIQAALPEDPVTGWVNQRELARLEHALATVDERPVILFVHQCLLPWQGEPAWKYFYGVENAQDVLDLLAVYGKTPVVFQGHAHRLNVQTVSLGGRDCTFVVAPSLTEYPLAWFAVDLTETKLRARLRRLPLFDVAEQSRTSGTGQDWRAGQPAWHDFTVDLA